MKIMGTVAIAATAVFVLLVRWLEEPEGSGRYSIYVGGKPVADISL